LVELHITDRIDSTDLDELRERIHAFNIAATGFDDGRSLSCIVRRDDGELVAGLDGFTWGGYAMIEWLWVDERQRGEGLGRRLVQAAEREAAARGCRVVRVNTHTFQAPGFYRKLGYEQIGFADGTPAGHGEAFLAKALP
jgi:ribosomal protein S18 acetylase RimI-like enzyme